MPWKLTRDSHPGKAQSCKSPSTFNNASPSSGVGPEQLLFLQMAFRAVVVSPLRRSILRSLHGLDATRLLESVSTFLPLVHSCYRAISAIDV